MPARILQGLTIVVTRPEQLANNLARLIEENGGTAVLYPVIRIEEPDDTSSRDKILNRLSSFDIAIFISPTAVSKTFELIDALPASTRIAAIGSSTVSALVKRGVNVSIKPEGHDSEALLQSEYLQAEQLAGKSVLIIRGQGGRELLAETLVSRGATVTYAEIYKRMRNDSLPPITNTGLEVIDIITVTSNEGLQNVYELAIEKDVLVHTALLVPGARCQQRAEELGFNNIIRADNATDAACIDALQKWAKSR